MAERPNAPALKAGGCKSPVGSNPTPSAMNKSQIESYFIASLQNEVSGEKACLDQIFPGGQKQDLWEGMARAYAWRAIGMAMVYANIMNSYADAVASKVLEDLRKKLVPLAHPTSLIISHIDMTVMILKNGDQ